MKNGPFEDVFPIKNGIFHCYVVYQRVVGMFTALHWGLRMQQSSETHHFPFPKVGYDDYFGGYYL